MEDRELQRLHYRRQYVLVPHAIHCPFVFQLIPVSDTYSLYVHTDLKTSEINEQGIRIILLGDLFDYENPEKDNTAILKDLYNQDFDAFLENTGRYSGRFVLFYLKNGLIRVVHDATATRKVYYSVRSGFVWLASQPNLLARIMDLKVTRNPSKIAYFHSGDFHRLHNSNLGDSTCFDEIRQLRPNHFFDFESLKPVRFWPDSNLEYLPVDAVADSCARMIKGYVRSIGYRYKIMLPVTSGKDSRILMAATREFKDEVYYYINKEQGLKNSSRDIAVPRHLFAKLNLDFHIISPYIPMDESFRKVYFENNPLASKDFLPHIYNYYRNYSDRVNLPGNNASAAFEIFKYREMKGSALNFARLYKVSHYDFALDCYEEWLKGCQDLCRLYHVNIVSLFYWEERLGNWGSQIQLEKDIAQEEFNPFNSRQLITLFLSVKPKYIELPNFILHKKIIRNLWPELLHDPINPGIESVIRKILIFLGIHGQLIAVKYKLMKFLSRFETK